ncbi:chromatin DNA-binding EKC/KEOPS complex subunit gon7 [Scheffersomyces spartinae]|uniref:EKC/KEOPS complex subunit GON7 n=1 Tax=Scheffersomyces spartinae TaxID=45513 RepID=A0A9P7VDM7_9ASCO|nr:chromatin DNA-binding EKC/KEOPS complex subunit gon7 [Scheffersomyces spartinae]KAG7196026.1 chromatin DNA-binding EKC/KEOPS complex subunit gon7 [Scheffersomyces spartinae]
MIDLVPTAIYKYKEETVELIPGEGPHSTDGSTQQISEVVTNAGGIDRDKPSEHNDTSLGHLRARLTTLHDEINIFLTSRMKGGNSGDSDDVERRVLDGDDDDNESDEV